MSGMEIGGLAGSLLAGRLADKMVNSSKDKIKDGSVGMRVRVRCRKLLFYSIKHTTQRFRGCSGHSCIIAPMPVEVYLTHLHVFRLELAEVLQVILFLSSAGNADASVILRFGPTGSHYLHCFD